jgi:hypothetical protein
VRPFGAQRDRVAAAIIERVHFLGDDIGGFAEGAGEDGGVFEDGGLPLGETVEGGYSTGGFDDVEVAGGIFADDVAGASDGL